MRDRRVILPLLLVLTLVAVFGGCKKKTPDTAAEIPAAEARQTPPPTPPKEVKDEFPPTKFEEKDEEPADIQELNRQGVLKTVYFAFDSIDLTPDAQATLRANASWLKGHSAYKFVIQGHCDERGTIEYNLALGDRRGNTVRDYLESLGVARARMRVLTFGEERPATPGHDESAWTKNRRAEFLLED